MIKPIRNNVLVKCFPGSEVTEGGLFISEAHRTESNRVEIIAVGRGLPGKPMRLKPGDIGYRVKDWGNEILDNGEKFYMMDQSAIIALE